MPDDTLFACGQLERYKGFWHVGMFACLTTFVAYNVGAWLARRDRHLALNVCVYGGLALYEIRQIGRHFAWQARL